MSIKSIRKILSFILSFNLLFQSLAPFLVTPIYADDSSSSATTADLTPTPTSTPEITPTPTDVIPSLVEESPSTTPTPTQEITPTPTEEITPTITSDTTPIITPEETSTPSVEITPSVEPTPTEDVTPTTAPSSNDQPQAPPQDNNQSNNSSNNSSSNQTSNTSTTTTQTTTTTIPESVNITTQLEQATLPQPTLSTDKTDYFPTDIAYITGKNFNPNETYSLHISSSDLPAVSYSVQVTADETGSFTFAYHLDGHYRPNYTIEASNSANELITTFDFTDSRSVNSVTVNGGSDVNVTPGEQIVLGVTVNHTDNWNATEYRFGNTGSYTKYDHTNHGGNGTDSETFNITAPTSVGVYDLEVVACKNDNCGGGSQDLSPLSTLQNAITVSSPSISSTWPACNFNCTANDVTVSKMELVSDTAGTPLSCTAGQVVNAYIKVTYDNHSTTRYAVVLLGDIWENGSFKQSIDSSNANACLDTLNTGAGTKVISTGLSWTCGESLEIKNLVLSWDTNTNTCSNFFSAPVCSSRKAQSFCNGGVGFVVTTPLVANYSSTNVCLNNQTTFTDETSGGTKPYSYDWNFGDSTTHSTDQNPTHQYSSAGNYSVSENVTDSTSPTHLQNTSTKSVSVWAPPSVNFNYSQATCPNNTVNFTNTSSSGAINGGSLTSYSWNFGDGSTSTEQNPSHDFSAPGDYNVSLTVNDSNSCNNIVQKTISIPTCNGTLTVQKTTNPSADNTQFSILASGTGSIVGGGDGVVSDSTDKVYIVTAGTYSVSETVPDGWVQVSNNCTEISIAAGENKTCQLVNTKKGHLIVQKTTNPSGDQQSFTITASSSTGGTVTGTNVGTVSDSSDWNYEVTPGTYSIDESVPTGWRQDSSNCSNIIIGAGETKSCEIVNTKYGSISGYKYENGQNTPLSGWIINLYLNNSLYDTQTTTTSGYNFSNLLPGVYTLGETQQTGWSAVSYPSQVTLTAGSDVTNQNFENFHNISISGQKYNDLNGNGLKDFGEPGISNWTIKLFDNTDNLLSSTTTDNSGNYEFSNLKYGTYRVREVSQTNWFQTSVNPADINAVSGQNVTGIDFGNRGNGTITVHKSIEGTTTDLTQFCFKLSNIDNTVCANSNGDAIFENVPSGSYTASEVSSVTGYTQTNSTCDSAMNIVNGGDTASCTITNTRNQGTVTFEKLVDDKSDVSSWAFSISGIEGTFHSGDHVTLDTGTYTVTESGSSDYTPFAISGICSGLEGNTATLNVTQDGGICTFTNHVNKGSITVTKVTNPDTWEGKFDFSLNKDNESFDETSLGNGDSHTFSELFPGKYSLSENQNGWLLSAQCSGGREESVDPSNIQLNPGENVYCTFTNTIENPEILIGKSNNAGGSKTPGESVIYTITIDVANSDVNNLKVKDLLPKGFVYRSGSYKVFKNGVDITGLVSEPVYHSPGTWTLGSVNANDEIQLMYTADIASDQLPGTYLDTAWAQGTSLSDSTVLALANDDSKVDTNFAGTSVNVVKDQTNGQSYDVENKVEGQVLGASTDLPATGANTLWLAAAIVSLYFGIKLIKSK